MKEELISIGLSDGEARVYLSLLKIGKTTVGPLIKDSKVASSKIYGVLQRLVEKGLSSYIIKDKTRYFQATPPNRIKELLEKKQKELDENKAKLTGLIRSLENYSRDLEKEESFMFTGIKGLKTAYELLLNGSSKGDYLKYFMTYDENHITKLDLFYSQEFHYFKKLGIRLRGITVEDYKDSEDFEKPPAFVKLKYVNFPLPGMIDIFKDKVLFTTWKDKTPYAYLIYSKEIAKNYLDYFNNVWKLAKS